MKKVTTVDPTRFGETCPHILHQHNWSSTPLPLPACCGYVTVTDNRPMIFLSQPFPWAPWSSNRWKGLEPGTRQYEKPKKPAILSMCITLLIVHQNGNKNNWNHQYDSYDLKRLGLEFFGVWLHLTWRQTPCYKEMTQCNSPELAQLKGPETK